MKKYLSIIFLCLFSHLSWAQSGEGYDPQNPGDPNVYYRLMVEASPKKGGSVSPSSIHQISAGATTYCYATPKTGYRFKQWMVGDSVVSTASSFTYTMPEENVTLIAYFDWIGNEGYNPENPGDPFIDGYQHKVTLYATPSAGGRFNSSSFYLSEGKTTNVYAYPSSGYRFVSWKQNGKIVSTKNPMEISMGTEDLEYTAQFVYDPVNPENPGANSFNASTGELIIDDFEAGRLSSAIYTTLSSDENYSKVKSITIIGQMEASDFGFLYRMTSCTIADISRTTGYNNVPNYAFEGASALKTLILPYSVESIGSWVFSGCINLTTLYCYATTPPMVTSTTFDGVPSSMKVLVPALSLELYQSSNYWKEFNISALDGVTKILTVSLPEDAKDGRYKNMTLELNNIGSGQVSRMLITDRTKYSFVNLIHNTKYNVYVKTANSVVLGEIMDIEIVDEDVETEFTQLKQPQTVTMSVYNPRGENLTQSTDITWFDESGQYLATGNSISGYVDGTILKYRIKLSNEAALYYVAPQDSVYEVKYSDNEFNCVLTPVQLVTLTGYVKNANTQRGIYDASVSISQQISGKQSRTVVAKTDVNGKFTAEVYNSPANISCAAYDYVNKSLDIESFALSNGNATMDDITMNSIVGATVNVSLTYQESVPEGETPEVQDWYSDYQNLSLSVFNLTTNQEVTQISNRYPQFVLMDGVKVGDELRLTLSSKKKAFEPIVVEKTVDESEEVNAFFAIKQFGGMQVSYQTTSNDAVVGVLYDKNGYLLQKSDFLNENTLSFYGLRDGDYTVIMMGKDDSYNSIYNVLRLRDAGLKENEDYTKNDVTIESGLIKSVNVANVPFLNIAKFQTIDSEKSSLTVSNSSVVVGNYLTFTGIVELQDKNITITDNMSLVVDIPSSAYFVKGSVMVGDKIIDNYTLADNTLTIPLNNVGQQNKVKFCLIPTEEGTFHPHAMVGFKANGEYVMIPIGSAHYTTKDLSISVPKTIAKTTIPVNGTAIDQSKIEIFDNGTKIGETTSLANGMWSITCELDDPYNLSMHEIYAKVTTKQGAEFQSEIKGCFYDRNAVEVRTVTMSFYNGWLKKNVEVIFDFENNKKSDTSYMFYTGTDITFAADLTNNDTTVVSGVKIYVFTNKNEVRKLPATYDAKNDKWVAISRFESNNLPINVSVDFDANVEFLFDREHIQEKENSIYKMQTELSELRDSISLINTNILQIDSLMQGTEYKLDELEKQFLSNGISHSAIKEYLSVLGIELDIEDSDTNIPDLNDDEWGLFVDSLLMAGELLLNIDTIDEGIEISELDSISNEIISLIEESVDLEKSLYSNLDTIRCNFGEHNYTVYPMSYTEIDFSKMNLSNTMRMGMTDNTSMLLYSNHPEYLIVDSINQKAWFMKVETSIAHVRSLASDEGGISELYNAIQNVQHWWTYIQDAIEFQIDSYKDKIKTLDYLIDSHKKEEVRIAVSFAKKADEIKAVEKQIALIEKTITMEDANKETELWTQKLKLENQREKLLKDLKIREKRINTLKKQQLACGAKLMPLKEMVDNFADLLKMGQDIYRFIDACRSAHSDINKWDRFISSIMPCADDMSNASNLVEYSRNDRNNVLTQYINSATCSFIATGLTGYFLVNKSAKFIFDFIAGKISDLLSELSSNALQSARNNSVRQFEIRSSQKELLKCNNEDKCSRCGKNPCECEDKCPECGNKPCTCNKACLICGQYPCECKHRCPICGEANCITTHFPPPHVDPIHDPSGYVYEGVSSNRVEGVTASCYNKETVEDIYGDLHDNIVKWDAEEYGQENPLYTDKNGFYQWFVPEGLWQVKYEKEGYETAYSDWLPVPPPQLDVNIGIVQNRQPEIKEAHAYVDGVEMTFDKYMIPAYLTTDYIKVSQNGKYVDGKIVLVDEEIAYRDENVKYASCVRFIPNTAFSASKEVTLIVNNRVKSYAGIQMAETYTQSFDIEKEVKSIVADSLVKVPYQGSKVVTLYVLPADAAVGKMMHAESSSEMLASLVQKDVTIDENGMAQFEIIGELPGTTSITFSINGVKTTATMIANVDDFETYIVNVPKASLISGSSVYRGTSVELMADSKDLKIWYTTDGTCPCDENSRKQYTEPIVINSDMVLKAMAENAEGDASEVVTFIYNILQSKKGVSLNDGWNWISFNMKDDNLSSVNTAMASGTWTSDDIIKDNKYVDMYSLNQKQWIGTLSKQGALNNTQMYKVRSSKSQTLSLAGEAVHPRETNITVASGWNYISYLPLTSMSVNDALKNYRAENGDVIKSQDAFATYSATNGWEGDLTTLTLGRGYMLMRSANASQTTFTYPVESSETSVKAPATAKSYRYADNMNIIGEVKGICVEEDDSLVAYVNGEVRGACRLERKQKVFLTVQGDENAKMAIVLVRDGEIVATASNIIDYQSNRVWGTSDAPAAITFITDDMNIDGGIENIKAIYSISGIKMGTRRLNNIPTGTYIIYYEKDGNTCVTKFIK